jgi:hypothetical protein
MPFRVRLPDGRVHNSSEQLMLAALASELSQSQAVQTRDEMLAAGELTAYGMRDGRIFFVDPRGVLSLQQRLNAAPRRLVGRPA